MSASGLQQSLTALREVLLWSPFHTDTEAERDYKISSRSQHPGLKTVLIGDFLTTQLLTISVYLSVHTQTYTHMELTEITLYIRIYTHSHIYTHTYKCIYT